MRPQPLWLSEAGASCPECGAPLVWDCSDPMCGIVACSSCSVHGIFCRDHSELVGWYASNGDSIEGPCWAVDHDGL
jgi:hypothetical protein